MLENSSFTVTDILKNKNTRVIIVKYSFYTNID